MKASVVGQNVKVAIFVENVFFNENVYDKNNLLSKNTREMTLLPSCFVKSVRIIGTYI